MEFLSDKAMSLVDVKSLVREQSSNSKSIVVDVRDTEPTDLKHLYLNGETYPISDWAMAQLTSKLGIPYTYFKKCYARDQQLGHLNYKIMGNHYGNKISFKMYKGEIIGALSPKYTEFANEQIAHIMTSVDKIGEMDIRSHKVSPQRFHVRLTEKTPILDDLYCGVQIDNSEIGKSSLSFKFFVYKQLCTNGMGLTKIESNIFAKKHVGITLTDMDSISKGLDCLTAFSNNAKRIIEDSMKETLTDRDMQTVFDNLIARHLISKQALDSISTEYFVRRYGKTKWAVANIITELSQQFTLDTRLTLEEQAGRLIA